MFGRCDGFLRRDRELDFGWPGRVKDLRYQELEEHKGMWWLEGLGDACVGYHPDFFESWITHTVH
jgi:hypothetical protein